MRANALSNRAAMHAGRQSTRPVVGARGGQRGGAGVAGRQCQKGDAGERR